MLNPNGTWNLYYLDNNIGSLLTVQLNENGTVTTNADVGSYYGSYVMLEGGRQIAISLTFYGDGYSISLAHVGGVYDLTMGGDVVLSAGTINDTFTFSWSALRESDVTAKAATFNLDSIKAKVNL